MSSSLHLPIPQPTNKRVVLRSLIKGLSESQPIRLKLDKREVVFVVVSIFWKTMPNNIYERIDEFRIQHGFAFTRNDDGIDSTSLRDIARLPQIMRRRKR